MTAVKGNAFGYHAFNITLFGGPQSDTGPTPEAELGADASNSPQTGTAPSGSVTYGPATLFSSDAIKVTTEGSLGASGSVTTTSTIDNINKSQSEIFTAAKLVGTATASATEATGSTTVTNGTVDTHSNHFNCSTSTCGGHVHDSANPAGTVTIPANPPPNYKVAGHVHLNDDTTDYFVIVFNEQIKDPDGSITVNPVHEYFGAKLDAQGNIVRDPPYGQGGSILQGDLILGRVVAGVTAQQGTGTTTTTVPGTTTTTVPGATTTTVPGTTTTTVPGATTTTTVPGTTTTTVAGAGTPTTVPATTTTTVVLSPPGSGSDAAQGSTGQGGTGAGGEVQATTVTEVGGGAYGFYSKVGLFGGPQSERGPEPTVTLPKEGSTTPVTASAASGKAVYGPAVIFESEELKVSTEGTTGEDAFVTSSTSVSNVGPGPLNIDSLSSTCTANSEGQTGSASFTGGTVTVSLGPNHDDPADDERVEIPANPAPNTSFEGVIDNVGDHFRVVVNEHQRSGDGITVNAVHMYLLGPIAKGDLIIGQSRCVMAAGSAIAAPGSGGSGSLANTGGGTLALRLLGVALMGTGLLALRRRRSPVSLG